MKILFVCHRFPFPPKRGGKIRPFNIIRHLAIDNEVTVCSLARSERGGARGRGNRSVLRALRDGARPRTGAGAANGGAAADAGTVLDGVLLFGPARAPHPCAAGGRTLRPRLRPLLVGRALRRRPARHARRSSTSATWIRRSGSSTLATSRSRFRSATGWRGASSSARSAGSRAASTCARRRRVPSGKRWRATARGVPTDWFPNGVDSEFFAPSSEPYDPRHDLLRRAHGLLPEPGVHVRLLRAHAAAVADAASAPEAADRRRGPVARGAEARRASRRHGDRLRARRAALPAPVGAHGRAAEHRPRHPEQDPRSDGGRRAGRDERGRGGRRGRSRPRALSGRVRRRRSTPPRSPGSSTIRQSAAGSRKRAARGCSRTTRGRTRCRSSTRSSSAASRSGPPETATASAGSRCQRGPAKQSANQVRCPAVTGTNQAKEVRMAETKTPWPVMVLAHNEATRIVACLDSIYAADPGQKFSIFVMANDTARRTKASTSYRSSWRTIAMPGKY